MQEQLKQQIDRLKAMGAAYVDARWYPLEETNTLGVVNGNLKENNSAAICGVGIRVLAHCCSGKTVPTRLHITCA
jgi:predicted Zn-dependent protease